MMNLWQLKVFLEVSETGSFSAAATRLHLTQPGVSQQVRALEGQLGTQLFVRRNWIDLPVRMASGQRAILSFEKGGSGSQILNDAFNQWQ